MSADGRATQLTQADSRNNTTTYTYDDAGRMTSVRDPIGNLTQYGYNAKGERASMTDAKNRVTTYTYDARGRQLTTTTQDNKTVSKAYDGLGLVTSMSDEEGRSTQYGFDAASQLLSVTDALNQITRYTYDPAGNKLTQVDANTHTTSYAWDNLNRRTRRTLPLGQFEQFTYDFEANMATRVDFNGKTTSYAYDSLNRLLSRTPDTSFTGAIPESFTYTSTGQRQSMTDSSGTTTYTYNNRDQVLTKATPQGTLTYTYDLSGNVASVVSSNANGTSVTYAWDANNRLQSVTDNRTNGTTSYTYDAMHQVTSFTYPNGVIHSYTYDARDHMSSLSVHTGTSVLAAYTQTFSPSGRKLSAAENTGRTPTYGYDPIYRLLNETISGDPLSANNGALSYVLDPAGNRLSLTSTLAALQAQSFTYDANDRISGDTFDTNGNTLTSGGVTYTYDFADRLISTSTGVQIAYDGDGNRVSETAGGITTKFLVDEHSPTGYVQVTEETVSGAVTAQYTHGLMRISQNRAGVVSYYGYDAGSSTRQLMNSAGAVTDRYAYDAFGSTVSRTGATVNPYQYRSEQLDASLQMYYLRARYYIPLTGRFLTADKWESPPMSSPETWDGSAGSWPGRVENLFAYATADPANRWDPTGLSYEEKATILAQIVKLSGTVTARAADIVRYGPFAGQFARPYIQSTLVILQIMIAKLPVPDLFLRTAVRWDVPGFFRGSQGTWELVIDLATNTIIHFNFVSR